MQREEETLPQTNQEAERALLGAILMNNQKLAEVDFPPEDFYLEGHRQIFRRMLELARTRHPFDERVLKAYLENTGDLERCGGAAYIARLAGEGIPSLEVAHYVHIIKQKAALRRVIQMTSEARERARQGEEPAEKILAELQADVAKIEVIFPDDPPTFSVDRLEDESRHLPVGKPSGWESLDKIGVSFNAGELAILGARSGHCKTSVLVGLLVNWLKAAADKPDDELFIFYSAEEPEIRIFHRLLNLLTAEGKDDLIECWTVNEIRDYHRDLLSRDTWPNPDSLDDAKELLRSWESRLLIVHRPAWTVTELEAHARRQAQKRKVGAVLVDYLQRIPPPAGRYDRRDIEVSTVGRRLKSLAVELSIPVVAAAQINREAAPDRKEITKAKSYDDAMDVIRRARPDLTHLREGGCEQEADLVLGLLNYVADYPTDEGMRPSDVTLFDVGTLKNRYGDVGRWVSMNFRRRYGLIRDAADQW